MDKICWISVILGMFIAVMAVKLIPVIIKLFLL
jgi:hypothetical protein